MLVVQGQRMPLFTVRSDPFLLCCDSKICTSLKMKVYVHCTDNNLTVLFIQQLIESGIGGTDGNGNLTNVSIDIPPKQQEKVSVYLMSVSKDLITNK